MDRNRHLPAPRRTIGLIAVGEFFGLALSKALSTVFDCHVCTEVPGVDDAEADLMVIDLSEDAKTAAEVRRFRAGHPRIPVVGIFSSPTAASRIAQVPAFAPVRRTTSIDELVTAARAVQPALDRGPAGGDARAIQKLESLSPREMELLPLLAAGLTLHAAARKLGITYKTADSYRSNLLRKLGVRDRIQLARFAIREGIIEP